MSRTSVPARHRATPIHSIALEGLAYTAKTNAATVGKPAVIVAAAGGLLFAAGAPAQAGTYAENIAATSQTPAAVAPAAAAGVHTVAAGDTLGAISTRYGVSLNTVLAQNGLSYASVIYPGQQIKVSGSASVAAPAAAASPAMVPAAATATQVSYTAPAPAAAPVQAQSGVSFASSAITPVAAPAPAPVATSGVGAALVASARAQIGAVQDCTILVEKALRSVGKTVGDLAPGQFYQYGTVVGSPAAGDLVITSGHVAIYVGNGKVISSGMNGANLTFEHDLSDLPGASFVRVS